MNLTAQVAKHLRNVHFGGNWTSVNLRDVIADVTWQQATTKVHSFNTIAALVFHMNYYISAVSGVLKGELLNAHDKYSFDLPSIQSEQDWKSLLDKIYTDAESFASLIEKLSSTRLEETFVDEKYGSVYRNLCGIIEHCHYHLGQIVLIKKILVQNS